MGRSADVVVIGGGVIGTSIALELAKRGRSVVVVDKGPAAGAGSTSSSSAIVRFHYSTWEGVATSWESLQLWQRWREHLGHEDEAGMARFIRTGALVLDAPGLDREKVLQLFRRANIPFDELDADDIAKRFPGLDHGRYGPPTTPRDERFWEPATRAIGGYFTPDAGFVDDPQLAAHNQLVAAQALGVSSRFGTEVVDMRSTGGRIRGVQLAGGDAIDAPIVVNAAGPYSRRVNEMAGVLGDFNVTTRALRQEVHVVPAPDDFALDHGGTFVADRDLGTYFRPHLGGMLVVGGTEPECDPPVWVADPDDYSEVPSVTVWEAQTLRLARRVPGVRLPSRPSGVGALYDVSDDWIPIYDRTSLDGFYVAIGTSGNQFKNAPMAGILMARLIDQCERGHDHDNDPISLTGPTVGLSIDLGHYSRRRAINTESSNSAMG